MDNEIHSCFMHGRTVSLKRDWRPAVIRWRLSIGLPQRPDKIEAIYVFGDGITAQEFINAKPTNDPSVFYSLMDASVMSTRASTDPTKPTKALFAE